MTIDYPMEDWQSMNSTIYDTAHTTLVSQLNALISVVFFTSHVDNSECLSEAEELIATYVSNKDQKYFIFTTKNMLFNRFKNQPLHHMKNISVEMVDKLSTLAAASSYFICYNYFDLNKTNED